VRGARRTRVALAAAACALPLAAVNAQLAADYSNSPVQPGSWSYVPTTTGSEARFMDSTGIIRVAVRCSRSTRQVAIARTSAAPAASLAVWTTSLSRTMPARFEANAMRVETQLSPYDALLDAIAFSRGRIAVAMPGSPPIVLAPGPEAARVIEDCRA